MSLYVENNVLEVFDSAIIVPLPPKLRRFIIEFNSRATAVYTSSAPVHPRRVYGDQTRQMVVALRQELEAQGCDAGPVSVRLVGMQQGVFVQGMVPSVSTIARMLRDAGMVRRNPRKRPKGPVVRFARTYAMELWQLDAFEFPLFTAPGCQGGQRVCVYQLIDDATRFDVGTRCFPRPENQHDAMIVVTQARAAWHNPGSWCTHYTARPEPSNS